MKNTKATVMLDPPSKCKMPCSSTWYLWLSVKVIINKDTYQNVTRENGYYHSGLHAKEKQPCTASSSFNNQNVVMVVMAKMFSIHFRI